MRGVSNKHCLLTFFISSDSSHGAYQINRMVGNAKAMFIFYHGDGNSFDPVRESCIA